SPLIIATGMVGFLGALIISSASARRQRQAGLSREVAEASESAFSVHVVRALPLALLLLSPLAIWALFVRIDDYGFTPFRVSRLYALADLVLLGGIGSVRLLRRRGPLSWEIPVCTALIALLGAVGPLSTVTVALRSQKDALASEYARLGIGQVGGD